MPKLGRRSDFAATAPFGTNDTPSFIPRIIGGNVVNVIDRSANNLQGWDNEVIVSEKPNNVDPRALVDFTRRYNQPYKDPFHNASEYSRHSYIPRRPDSKDISRRYPSLRPFDGNRMKNLQMSTVFEPETWTKRYYKDESSPSPFADFNVGVNGTNGRGYSNSFRSSPDNPRHESNTSTDSVNGFHTMTDNQFRNKLLSMIPRGMYLPETPIQLSQKDEMRLLDILTRELYYTDPMKLKDAYLDIANRVDKPLTGLCQYQELYHTFTRVSFPFPPDIFQLVAAMFVSNQRNQRDINYEKFLSFVGVAMKNKDKLKPSDSDQGFRYYRSGPKQARAHSPIRYRPGSPFISDGGETKLLRMVEEQLIENDFAIDLERLVTSFQTEDRDMRGTLSADQIKKICVQHRMPIQESLMNSLLHRCQDNNKDEQYNWWSFVKFLERVQPVKTGLPIPRSKRPLEYARVLPSPIASWPKGELRTNGPSSPASWNQYIGHGDIQHQGNTSPASRSSNEPKPKQTNRKEDAGWFKNYMKFADALYRHDERFEGSLPYNDVLRWSGVYNRSFQLDISDGEITKALNLSTKRGKVDLHKFLSLIKNQY